MRPYAPRFLRGVGGFSTSLTSFVARGRGRTTRKGMTGASGPTKLMGKAVSAGMKLLHTCVALCLGHRPFVDGSLLLVIHALTPARGNLPMRVCYFSSGGG